MHRSVRRSLLTGAPPRPSTHAGPGPLRPADHRRWVIARRLRRAVWGAPENRRGPHRTCSIEVALSRRLSYAAAARTTRHWRGEDGLWHAAELLTLPVRHASHTP